MSQPASAAQPPAGAVPTPPPESTPVTASSSTAATAPPTTAAVDATDGDLTTVAPTGGLLTPGEPMSTDVLDPVLIGADAAASALAASSFATAGPSSSASTSAPSAPAAALLKPATPVPNVPPQEATAADWLARMSSLQSQRRAAQRAGDVRSVEDRMLALAEESWYEEVYFDFPAPTDIVYFALRVLLLLVSDSLPAALNALSNAPPSVKTDRLALHLATLASGVEEGVYPAVWGSRRSLLAIMAEPPMSVHDAAFRPLFLTLLDEYSSTVQLAALALVARVYTSISLVELGEYIDLPPAQAGAAVRAHGWTVDEAAGRAEPVATPPPKSRPSTAADFDRLARRVLALEQSLRVD